MIISDCCASSCCATPAPVNIVGAPGLAGAPGSPGAVTLLGQENIDFQFTSAFQTIPINALQYIITQIIICFNDDALDGASGNIYSDSGLTIPLTTGFTFVSFPTGTWEELTLAAAAKSGGDVLTGTELYVKISIAAAAAAHGYVKVYGYVL